MGLWRSTPTFESQDLPISSFREAHSWPCGTRRRVYGTWMSFESSNSSTRSFVTSRRLSRVPIKAVRVFSSWGITPLRAGLRTATGFRPCRTQLVPWTGNSHSRTLRCARSPTRLVVCLMRSRKGLMTIGIVLFPHCTTKTSAVRSNGLSAPLSRVPRALWTSSLYCMASLDRVSRHSSIF